MVQIESERVTHLSLTHTHTHTYTHTHTHTHTHTLVRVWGKGGGTIEERVSANPEHQSTILKLALLFLYTCLD